MASKITGDLSKLKKFCNNFSKDLLNSSKKSLKETANNTVLRIQGKIDGQNFTPLKDNTIKQKGNSKILIETGTLRDSIQVNEVKDLQVVIAPNGQNPSGLSNSDLAIIHEYGTDKIPPRPFIKPVYEEVQPEYKEKIKNTTSNVINKYT